MVCIAIDSTLPRRPGAAFLRRLAASFGRSRSATGLVAVWAFVTLAGCATPVPPSNFQLARQAVERGDFVVAGQRFRAFADEELARLDAGGDLSRANNTALAYRDAANNFFRGKDLEQALGALERCVSVLARHAEGELCKNRGQQMLAEAQAPAERAERFAAALAPFDEVREARRPQVAAQLQAQRERAERQRRDWEAQAPLRAWQAERDRVERDLTVARSSETMLMSMGKDASGIRMNRRLLEARLADLDARKPNPDGSVRPAQGPSAFSGAVISELGNMANDLNRSRNNAPSASAATRVAPSTTVPSAGARPSGAGSASPSIANSGTPSVPPTVNSPPARTSPPQPRYTSTDATRCVRVIPRGQSGCNSRRCLQNTCNAKISVWSRGGGMQGWGLAEHAPGQIRMYHTNIFDDGSPIEYQACTWDRAASFGPSRNPCRYN